LKIWEIKKMKNIINNFNHSIFLKLKNGKMVSLKSNESGNFDLDEDYLNGLKLLYRNNIKITDVIEKKEEIKVDKVIEIKKNTETKKVKKQKKEKKKGGK